jgi:hypothetical protein
MNSNSQARWGSTANCSGNKHFYGSSCHDLHLTSSCESVPSRSFLQQNLYERIASLLQIDAAL